MEKKTKSIAGISLGVMAAGFGASFLFPEGTARDWLQDAFEAGLVGGLADWFAVTALFRHPLGIPIPHTALLPKNREKVTHALVSAIENELLSKESIKEKLREVQFARLLLGLLEQEEREQLGAWAAVMLEQVVRSFPMDAVLPFVEKHAKELLQSLVLAPMLPKLAQEITEKQYDAAAFDALLDKAEDWISRAETRDMLGQMAMGAFSRLEIGGFMQFAVNAFLGYMNEDKLGGIIQNFVRTYLFELRMPNHPRRSQALGFIRGELERLSRSDKLIAMLEQWKREKLEQWDMGETLSRLFTDLQQKLIAYMQEPRFAHAVLLPLLNRTLERLSRNEELLDRADDWIRGQITRLVEANHAKIGQLVYENVRKLDDAELIAMMEDKVGKDLQWIRVNGAVCGWLIGLALGVVKYFL
jgi:uncharacterized membrane-anchored protein YjiN (DUF445 family)